MATIGVMPPVDPSPSSREFWGSTCVTLSSPLQQYRLIPYVAAVYALNCDALQLNEWFIEFMAANILGEKSDRQVGTIHVHTLNSLGYGTCVSGHLSKTSLVWSIIHTSQSLFTCLLARPVHAWSLNCILNRKQLSVAMVSTSRTWYIQENVLQVWQDLAKKKQIHKAHKSWFV